MEDPARAGRPRLPSRAFPPPQPPPPGTKKSKLSEYVYSHPWFSWNETPPDNTHSAPTLFNPPPPPAVEGTVDMVFIARRKERRAFAPRPTFTWGLFVRLSKVGWRGASLLWLVTHCSGTEGGVVSAGPLRPPSRWWGIPRTLVGGYCAATLPPSRHTKKTRRKL